MSSPATNEESLIQHLLRSTKNCCTRLFGCVQTADEVAKIKYKESQIAGRKKAFGVAYLDLLAGKASDEELKKCIDDAVADLQKTQDEISELQKEIERVGEETKKKIIEKPGATPAAATTASATTPAPASDVETKPAETAASASAPVPAPETETPAPEPVSHKPDSEVGTAPSETTPAP